MWWFSVFFVGFLVWRGYFLMGFVGGVGGGCGGGGGG